MLDTKYVKIYAIFVVAAISIVSFASIISMNASDTIEGNEDAQLDALFAEFNDMMMKYGITYDEYRSIIEALDGKAISITTVDGEIHAEVVNSVQRGKTMTDSKLNGDYLTIYIDTITMSGLVSVGITGFTTALGAAIGSVALPGIGTLGGTVAGAIIGHIGVTSMSMMYTFMQEQLELDNGVWIKLKVRGHASVLGHNIYYPLPPNMWKLNGWGAQ